MTELSAHEQREHDEHFAQHDWTEDVEAQAERILRGVVFAPTFRRALVMQARARPHTEQQHRHSQCHSGRRARSTVTPSARKCALGVPSTLDVPPAVSDGEPPPAATPSSLPPDALSWARSGGRMGDQHAGNHRLPTSLWMRLETAAQQLDMTPAALRRALERAARRAPDGGIEADFDGVRARKLGHRWRVQLGPAWAPRPAAGEP